MTKKVMDAAKELLRDIDIVRKDPDGSDFRHGNPKPDQWDTIVVDADVLKDAIDQAEEKE